MYLIIEIGHVAQEASGPQFKIVQTLRVIDAVVDEDIPERLGYWRASARGPEHEYTFAVVRLDKRLEEYIASKYI